MEQPLKYGEINSIVMENYILDASFCRRSALRCGTCIFVLNYLKADKVNVERYCLDFDIEPCAIKIQCGSFHMYVLSVYRAPPLGIL
jgi:hypothetical protein